MLKVQGTSSKFENLNLYASQCGHFVHFNSYRIEHVGYDSLRKTCCTDEYLGFRPSFMAEDLCLSMCQIGISMPKPIIFPFFCNSSRILKKATYREAQSICDQENSFIWSPNIDDPYVYEMVEETMAKEEIFQLWTGIRRKNGGFSV